MIVHGRYAIEVGTEPLPIAWDPHGEPIYVHDPLCEIELEMGDDPDEE